MKEYLQQFRKEYFPTAKEMGVIKYNMKEIQEMMKKPLYEEDIKRIESRFPTEFAKKVHLIGGTCSSRPENLEERV